jgi:GAF domain-containing protein
MAAPEVLTHAVSGFARTLACSLAVGEVLNDLAQQVTAVAGVAGAGVSVLESGQLRFMAASDERCAALGRAKEAGQAGPGVDACRTGKIVTVADLSGISRGWGAYQGAAQEAGIVAVASVPMRRDGESIGAVGLYSTTQQDWPAAELGAAVILANMATGYLVHARELDRQSRLIGQLSRALDSRIMIEQAKGVLAAERQIPVDEAFEVLRRHARSHSASLHSVAEAVVNLGLRP